MEEITHIMIDEDGIPRTINKGVKVNMIEVKYSAGDSAQYIAEHYGIEIADVYAALTYFHDNRAYFEERRHQVAPLIYEAKARTEALNAEFRQIGHGIDFFRESTLTASIERTCASKRRKSPDFEVQKRRFLACSRFRRA